MSAHPHAAPLVRRPPRFDEPTILDLAAIFVELGGVVWFVLRRRAARNLTHRSKGA